MGFRNRPTARGAAVGALVFCGLAGSGHAIGGVVEGVSNSGADAAGTRFRYRCEDASCRFEAVLDEALRDDVKRYEWRFGDGRSIETTDSVITHELAGAGSQQVTLTVEDVYCDLYVTEAYFSTSITPSAPPSAGGGGTQTSGVSLTSASVRLAQDGRRTVSEPLAGATLSGGAFIFVSALEGAESVTFKVSGGTIGTRTLRVEKAEPYDLAGGSADSARAFDTRTLPDGAYRLNVEALYGNGTSESVAVGFSVRNEMPEQIAEAPSDTGSEAPTGSGGSQSGGVDEPGMGAAVPDTSSTLTAASVRLARDERRTASGPLSGATLSGGAFVFVDAPEGVRSVTFKVSGSTIGTRALRVEKAAPYDLAGGSVDSARAFDTRALSDGAYRLIVEVLHGNGEKENVAVDFSVRNETPEPSAEAPTGSQSGGADEPDVGAATPEAPSTDPVPAPAVEGELVFSTRSSRRRDRTLAGRSVEGRIYAFLDGVSKADSVRFFLDDPTLSGEPLRVEKRAPWDVMGGSNRRASPLDTRDLGNGRHVLSAQVVRSGRSYVVHASFTVAN